MQKTSIALGFFDGLHRGHAELIKYTKLRASEKLCKPMVLTFDDHPDKYVSGKEIELLTDSNERAAIIRRLFDIEDVMFIHFSHEVRKMPWREFLDGLCSELMAVHLVVGEDFRFGYKGEGNVQKLREYCAETGISCDVIPQVLHNNEVISSTLIRKLIKNGDIDRANELLGHPHEISASVKSGYKLGRRIGAPTINMEIPKGVIFPRFGVYATKVFFDDESHYAVTNVGTRPTTESGEDVTVESYILDYSGNVYGKWVRVEFMKFLRNEEKFSNIDELKEQIKKDSDATKAFFTCI